MKNKFFLLIMFVCAFGISIFLPQNFLYAENQSIKIITDQTYIYKTPQPTEKLNAEDTTQTNVLGIANFNEVYELVETNGNFCEIVFSAEENGYILKAYTCDALLTPLQKALDTNAILIKDSETFLLIDNTYTKQTINLPANTRVKLLSGINSGETYSQITVRLDGENKTYYVLSNNINADGVNSRTVVALLLIFTCTIIFLIIYSFYRAKKNQN